MVEHKIGKLGKQGHEHNDKTLMLARFFLPEIYYPSTFDFDKGRSPFPIRMWGNDDWGDCVIAGEANQLLRLERIEQRRTLPLGDQDAIDRYKALTGAHTPGDGRDNGLVVLQAMRNWHHSGWSVGGKLYGISAYGELEPNDPHQLRMACYSLHGIHFGFSLPLAARAMTSQKLWDYKGETGPEWEPGSWGGHLVFSKSYTKRGFRVLTWGHEILATDAFISRYCDEAWSVVDSLDSWQVKQTIDVVKLQERLGQISSKVNR